LAALGERDIDEGRYLIAHDTPSDLWSGKGEQLVEDGDEVHLGAAVSYVAYWHEADVRRLPGLGPLTGA